MKYDEQSDVYKAAYDALEDASEQIHLGICDSMPYPSLILEQIFLGVRDNTWTPLPPKSYLRLKDGKRGVGLIAIREGEALNEHGQVVELTTREGKRTGISVVVGK